MKRKLTLLFAILSVKSFSINYYVSPAGDDNNNGLTISTSFITIERATYAVAPGDTVFIRNGIYTKIYPESLIAYLTISGTANNPIAFKNYRDETPILQLNNTNWAGISINGNDYIIIDGLTIIGNNDNITLAYAQAEKLNTNNPSTSGSGIAINTEYNNETNKPHHNIVRNCTISKCGGGGIYTYNADYSTIENNTIFECGWYAPYGNSGISLYQSWNSDNFNGIKNYITGNTCYRNENYIPFFVAGTITDGNGIIIDDGRNTQNNSTLGIYNGITYVANNLVFDNGARGIHCYESDNVIVINNTCYQNCQSSFTREGELTAFDASNISFINNIVSPSANIPPIFAYDLTTSNIVSQNNLITNNFNLANPTGINNISGNANFVFATANASQADFHIQSPSPAINSGSIINAPLLDKDGNTRLLNNFIDIGCYEFQNLLSTSIFDRNEIKIYPNPAQNLLLVDINNEHNQALDFEFYNVLGQKIKTYKIESDNETYKFDVSSLDNGLYFIKRIKDNKELSIGKFIKN
jgi:parallel beta-helix repeat protein